MILDLQLFKIFLSCFWVLLLLVFAGIIAYDIKFTSYMKNTFFRTLQERLVDPGTTALKLKPMRGIFYVYNAFNTNDAKILFYKSKLRMLIKYLLILSTCLFFLIIVLNM